MIVHGRLKNVDFETCKDLFADIDIASLYMSMGEQGKWETVQASNAYDADDARYLERTSFEIPDLINKSHLESLISAGIFIPL